MATYFWGPQKSLIVPTPDLAFLMHDDDSGRCQMHQVGVPELPIIHWAAEKFKDKNKLFIDCGAHMGAYSVILSDHFKEVHAFEAQRRTYMQLCGNVFINEKTNIYPYNNAVTSYEAANMEATLHVVSEDGGGSTLCAPQASQNVLSKEKVRTINIDSFNFQNVGLIKMDIEGHELEALKGAENTLITSNFPPIIFEANEDSWYAEKKKQLFEHLQSYKYYIAEIRPFKNMYIASKSPL